VISVDLPPRIPAACVVSAAQDYQIPEMAILAILKVESGGRTGVTNKNTNGSIDYGPAQLNSNSWARYFKNKYGISVDAMTNDMCQAIRAQGYVIRSEMNACRGDLWCGIGRYHSPVRAHQVKYIGMVYAQYEKMQRTGKF